MPTFEARLRAANAKIQAIDPALAKELEAVYAGGGRDRAEALTPVLESLSREKRPTLAPQAALETIVRRTGRPVLAVVSDTPRLEFRDAESEVWRARLVAAREHLGRAIRAVGRVELTGHTLGWVGTGWLVDRDVVVTNRHVAAEFAARRGEQFVFRQGATGRAMTASLDFLEELGRDGDDSRVFAVVEVLYVAGEDEPDVAFLRVENVDERLLADPIPLAVALAPAGRQVAAIGYPARDSRIPELDLMLRVFGEVFDKKRLAPGIVTGTANGALLHDCSTLGGNSGSVVVDLESGEAVALHFAGRFLEANYAVPATTVAALLYGVRRRESHQHRKPAALHTSDCSGARVDLRPIDGASPMRVGADIGAPEPVARASAPSASPVEDESVLVNEGRPADYANRSGYDPDFLGIAGVPLPTVLDDGDVLRFLVDGKKAHELRYEHFSVVMSKSRRLCWFSAVNIDGGASRKVKRVAWRTDPRIQPGAQVVGPCYGTLPKFARGHMTRREDPVWGDAETAARANADSMHMTNAVPQLQPFNAPIWLGLEDYALDHARGDEMRISVFTGPFLKEDDPVRYGVAIPRAFWKVIAFVHDRTAQLCATGYSMSQGKLLSDQEFVFGVHETAQLPIRDIEQRSGLSFGTLRDRDPLDRREEGIERARVLTDFNQITFG